MSPQTEQVYQSALALPAAERLMLVEALLAECDAPPAQYSEESWRAEIQRRSAEIDAGTAILTPWPEVKRRVRQKLEGQLDG